ncbi:FAD/NAD(P)-binding domain-containing protein [Gymnopus androsaceus JB14]|uniref:FAD/NAD(P)-binding domain-containing protein n=1 Tax=Gymnopus androsaceus JB14 TaxID=1447944 RepID=A0A6A4IGK8_9AGAR|nr:FAD/NAD(P)-binding domain-containing protein [Gymnopus androsaceus JB14]
MSDFEVAIVGAGLVGLVAAAALSRAGISVVVFEATSSPQEVGAGVGIGPNAVRALKGLGVFDAILARAKEPEGVQRTFHFHSPIDPHGCVFHYQTSCPDPVALPIYRPTFLEAVIGLLDPSIIHFNKRCTSISIAENGKHIVHFSDGTNHEAELIIGADGVKSVTRSYVVGEHTKNPLVFTNTVAIEGSYLTEDLRSAGLKTEFAGHKLITFLGSGKHIIGFSIKGGTVINFVVLVADHDKPKGPQLPPPWVESTTSEELKSHFESWGHDPMIILDHLKNPSKWSIHAVNPLESFVRDKVVLIGDSAHAMLPHLGAGVGQGFEDVFVLVQLLTHPQARKANLPDILAQYNRVRPPRANAILRKSQWAGEIYDSYRSEEDNGRIQQCLSGYLEDVWGHDLEKDVASAFEVLHRSHIFRVSKNSDDLSKILRREKKDSEEHTPV